MTHLHMSAHLEAPIEHVFELGTDFKRYPEWNVSYREVLEVTGPTDVVGTKVHVIMTVLGRPIDGWGEIVEIDKPRLMRFKGTGPEETTLSMLYRLTPTETGTDFETDIDYELPKGLLGQIADKLFVEKTVERDLRHSQENFKALVEAKVPVMA